MDAPNKFGASNRSAPADRSPRRIATWAASGVAVPLAFFGTFFRFERKYSPLGAVAPPPAPESARRALSGQWVCACGRTKAGEITMETASLIPCFYGKIGIHRHGQGTSRGANDQRGPHCHALRCHLPELHAIKKPPLLNFFRSGSFFIFFWKDFPLPLRHIRKGVRNYLS